MKLTRLDKLFLIEHGSKLDLNKTDPAEPGADAVVFVNRSGINNGFGGLVRRVFGLEAHPPGRITVALGGSTLASFVQQRPFYTAQNIDVLSPLQDMDDETKLYYCLCIEANRFRYSTFGREANRTLKTLLVPSRSEVPNWVQGATRRAAEALTRDLNALAGDTATRV